MADNNQFPTLSVSGYWYRLIPSRFPTIDIYRRVAPREEWQLAASIETLTNPRVRLREKSIRSSKTTVPAKFQNWNHAPYTYPNPQGSRFLSPDSGVLELSDTVQSALAVSIRKREEFLGSADVPSLEIEMRVLKHEINGTFVDLTSLAVDTPQSDRWALGTKLIDGGANGVQFRCPHRATGLGIAVFNPDTLGPSIQTQHYKFRWDGARIQELYDYRDESDGKPILAEQVFAEKQLLSPTSVKA